MGIKKKLLVVLVLLAILLLAGYLLINYFFINATSELDAKTPEEQKQALVNSEEYGDLEEVAALKKQVELMEKGKDPLVGEDFAETENGGTGSDSATTNETGGGGSTSGAGVPSKKAIEDNLRTKMYNLRGEYNGKLNALAGKAKAEYIRLRSGNSNVKLNDLAGKYIAMGNSLEAQCDARVYAAIAYAENQLEYYNYKSSVPGQARQQYLREKAQRRKNLLNSIK